MVGQMVEGHFLLAILPTAERGGLPVQFYKK